MKPEPLIEPIPTVGAPKDLEDFCGMFLRAEDCLAHLVHLRESQGFICESCNYQGQPWKRSQGAHKCPQCRKEQAVTAGTVFYRSNVPLQHWFRAAWELVNPDDSVWANYLQKVTGIEDQAARRTLRSLRTAMGTSDVKLAGNIQVDELEIECRKTAERHMKGKITCHVLVAAENKENGKLGKIRMQHVVDFEPETIQPLIRQWVTSENAVIHTDGWRGYNGLASSTKWKHERKPGHGVDHNRVSMSVVRTVYERFLARFTEEQRGAITPNHLQGYLNEFCFVHNGRRVLRGRLFSRVIELAMQTSPIPTKSRHASVGEAT
jgi:hypothetical protein